MGFMTKEKFRRIRILTLCLVFFALCLTPGHLRTVFAQEVEVRKVRVTLDTAETVVQIIGNVEDIEDVIVIDDGIIYIDMETSVDEGESKAEEEAETPGERNMEFQENEQPGDKFPPEVQEMMEKEDISKEDLMNDPELRKKFSEKVKKRMGEKGGEDSPPDGKPGEGKGKAVVGLERYTSVIVKKNLFRNLGSGGEKKGTSYALTAVISDSSGESKNKAIIEQQGGGASYYVFEGDTFAGEMKVTDIEDAYIEYTYYVDIPSLFDATFVVAMGYRLAAEMAMPLNGDRAQAKDMKAMALDTISEAKRHDSGAKFETHDGNTKSNYVDARG